MDWSKFCEQFLAPLAEGQRAIVMALCPLSFRSSVHASEKSSPKPLI